MPLPPPPPPPLAGVPTSGSAGKYPSLPLTFCGSHPSCPQFPPPDQPQLVHRRSALSAHSSAALQTMAAAATPPLLLDLPEDVLLRIGLQLKLNERLRLAEVCRKLRQLCAGPSELWRVLRARLRADGGGDAALQALVHFRRQARGAAA